MVQRLKPSWQFLIPLVLVIFFLSLLSSKTRRAPWYEQWAWNVVAPVTTVFSWFGGGLYHTWDRYVYLVGAQRENERLQEELKKLRQKMVAFEESVAENERLVHLLDLKNTQSPASVAARVIAYDPRSEFKSVRINKGSRDGLLPDMPVIATEGLVGKVGPVFDHDAIVLLIIDPASTVDAFVERSRVRGLLNGAAKKTELRPCYFLTRLEYLKRSSDIQAGDQVITSGLDQLYPKGILVGTVETVEHNRYGIFVDAEVVPTVDFSRLEEVLVLKK
ncbi:MAG: rod shape-determining protein MreC [Deltaproteobacteria bacterium]|nr:rod shape-determining protein MreC [Deltaproteobacteria bacterium]